MITRNGPFTKSVESVLGSEGSLWWERFVKDACSSQSQQPVGSTVTLYTVSRKNVAPLACYNFDANEWILILFGRNVTDKVDNQKCLTMPPQLTCASALPGKTRKHENYIFHSIGVCYTQCTCALCS